MPLKKFLANFKPLSRKGAQKTSRRKEIFKDAGIYTVSSYGAQLFDVVNGVLVRRFLGPANMGIWSFLQIVLNYAKHSGLGVTMATARDVPYFRGKGDLAKAEEVKNLVFSFTLITAVLGAIGIVLFACLNRSRYSRPIFYGLVVVAILIVLQRLYNLYTVLLRAHKEFIFAGSLNFLSSVSSVLLTLVLTWKFKLYGFFVSLILNYLFTIAVILFRTPYRFAFFLSLKPLLPLLSLGSAVLISDMLKTVLTSIDRILITKYLGFKALGIYSIALMASNYLYSLPNMLGIIFFPHFQEVLAERDNTADLGKFLKEPTLCLAYFFPCLIGLVWIFSSWFVPLLLPEYVSGITALKYLSLGAFFLALTHPYSMFIITIRKHWQLIPLQGGAVVFGFGVTWLFIQRGGGIGGVAIAGILISGVYFLILSIVSLKRIYNWSETLFLYLKVFGAFAYSSASLYLVDHLFHSLKIGLGRSLLEYFVFLISMMPLFIFAENEVRVLSTLWRMAQPLFQGGRGGEEEHPAL